MTTVLSQASSQTNNMDLSSMKTGLLAEFQAVFKEIINKMEQQTKDSVSSQLFYNYHKQISNLIDSSELFSYSSYQKSDSQRQSSLVQKDNDIQQKIFEQPSYLFLRNVWLGKNQQSKIFLSNYDPQDHIDRVNKAVAMIRQQTVYMTKKQNYLYEKQDSNYALMNENPFYMKMKQQFQKLRMENQQLQQKIHFQSQTIQKLNKDKVLLQNCLRSYKKKFQQMEKSWIEVSKKNICLQQESLVMKSQNSRSRLNMMRQSGDFTHNVEMKQSILINSSTVSHRKLTEDIITDNIPSSNKVNILKNSISTDVLRPLDNVFIDIKLKQNQLSPKLYSNRYGKMNSENQQSQSQQDCLKDVTQRINSNNINNNQNNQQLLMMSHSDQLIAQATTLKLRNIRNQTSARKTLLLASTRSVDLSSKTSLNKPKFQRTKPNNNLQQVLLKSVTKDISIEINIQKPNIVKNQFLVNDQTSNLVKSFRNQPRSFISRREEVKS